MGGLGIGNLIKRNEALLGKWLWRFLGESNALWHQVIKSKYGVQENGWVSTRVPRGMARNPWKAIIKGYENFVRYSKLRLGNGSRVLFWSDKWIGDLPLMVRYPHLYIIALNPNARVAEYVEWESDHNYHWNIIFRRNLREWEEEEYIDLIGMIQNQEVYKFDNDEIVWEVDKLGNFTTSSFFRALTCGFAGASFYPYKMIWKSGIPSKIRVLSWLTALERVNTADLMQVRKLFMNISPSCCVICKDGAESIDHLLLHCSFARSVWGIICKEFEMHAVFPRSWYEFLSIKWAFKGDKIKSSVPWRCCCMALLWCIWKEMNNRIFENKEEDVNKVWDRVCTFASLWAFTSNKFGIVSISDIQRDWAAAMA